MPVNPYPYVNVATMPENITIALAPTPRPRIEHLQLSQALEFVSMDVGGTSTVRWTIRGTWEGQIFFESSLDGETWSHSYTADYGPLDLAESDVLSTTENGQWVASSAGFLYQRFRGVITSGIADITAIASVGAGPLQASIPLPLKKFGNFSDSFSSDIEIGGATTLRVQLRGTWSGTVLFQGSTDDGTTWGLVDMLRVPYMTTPVHEQSTTINGSWVAAVAGLTRFRVIGTAGLTGTVMTFFVAAVGTSVIATAGTGGLVGLTDTQLRATPVPVTGIVISTGLTDVQLRATPVPVSGMVATGALTDVQLRATPVPVSGTVAVSTSPALTDVQLRASAVPVSVVRPATATLANVTVSTASAVLLAANASRRKMVLFNDSGRTVYVAFAATASLTSATRRVLDGDTYESLLDGYTGVVSGIVSIGSGPVRVTEVT